MSDFTETHPMQRENDDLSLRVSRSVPVWALITALVMMVVSATTLQLGLTRQGELTGDLNKKLAEQSQSIQMLSTRVETLSEKITETKTLNQGVTYRLEDLDRRISTLERRVK